MHSENSWSAVETHLLADRAAFAVVGVEVSILNQIQVIQLKMVVQMSQINTN